MTDGTRVTEFDLSGFFAVLQRRRLILVVVVVVLTAVAVMRSVTSPASYSSTAEVVVRPPTGAQILDETGRSGRDVVATEVRIMGSATVLNVAAESLGFQPDVSIQSRDDSEVVEVQGRAETAEGAADTANVVAETYLELREERTVEQLASASAELQRQYDVAQKAVDGLLISGDSGRRQSLLSQMAAISSQLDQLELAQVTAASGAEVISPAEPPDNRSSPKPLRDGMLALVAALILGVGAVLLFDRLDDSLRDVEQAERLSGLPVLGVVPVMTPIVRLGKPLPAALLEPGSAFAEAFRTLRTALRFFDLDGSHRTLLITSPTVGDGKTTTVANLGVALAWSGRTVVMVSCDLRHADLPGKFGIDRAGGLTSILLGEADVESSLVAVEEVPGLVLLPPGTQPPNPAEILGSDRMAAVLEELGERFDHVLLDCPPVLAVSDALALCESSKAPVLLVVRSGSTTTHALRRCLDLLRQLNPHLLGVVLNRSDLAEAQDGSYLYAGTEPDPARSSSFGGLPSRGDVAGEHEPDENPIGLGHPGVGEVGPDEVEGDLSDGQQQDGEADAPVDV